MREGREVRGEKRDGFLKGGSKRDGTEEGRTRNMKRDSDRKCVGVS